MSDLPDYQREIVIVSSVTIDVTGTVSLSATADVNLIEVGGVTLATPTVSACVPVSIENDAIAYDVTNDRFKVDVEKWSATDTVDVNVTNATLTVAVSGTVTVTGTVAATQSGTWNIGTVGTITNTVTVSGSVTVSGTVAATQSGTWNIATVTTVSAVTSITNTVTVSGTVAATQSGTWNINTLATITNTVTVSVSGTVTVTGTVAISGTVTVTGTVAATQSGTWNIGTVTTVSAVTSITNTVTVTGSVTVSGTVAATQSGTWNIATVTTVSTIAGTVTVTGSVNVKAAGVTTIVKHNAANNSSATIHTVTAGKTFYLVGAWLTTLTTAEVTSTALLEVDTAGDSNFRQLLNLYVNVTAAEGPSSSQGVSLPLAVPMPFAAGTVFRVTSDDADFAARAGIIGWEE